MKNNVKDIKVEDFPVEIKKELDDKLNTLINWFCESKFIGFGYFKDLYENIVNFEGFHYDNGNKMYGVNLTITIENPETDTLWFTFFIDVCDRGFGLFSRSFFSHMYSNCMCREEDYEEELASGEFSKETFHKMILDMFCCINNYQYGADTNHVCEFEEDDKVAAETPKPVEEKVDPTLNRTN